MFVLNKPAISVESQGSVVSTEKPAPILTPLLKLIQANLNNTTPVLESFSKRGLGSLIEIAITLSHHHITPAVLFH